jgi:hypothetical protein
MFFSLYIHARLHPTRKVILSRLKRRGLAQVCSFSSLNTNNGDLFWIIHLQNSSKFHLPRIYQPTQKSRRTCELPKTVPKEGNGGVDTDRSNDVYTEGVSPDLYIDIGCMGENLEKLIASKLMITFGNFVLLNANRKCFTVNGHCLLLC